MGVVIVAAHPDDEVLGVGTLLPYLRSPSAIVHITDGAPRSGDDARNAGCGSWEEYAALRRREFQQAMSAAGASDCVPICLDCPDQQAAFRIANHATYLAALFEELRPSAIFTHAYEGGHPDHDAAAAAVHAAIYMLKAPCLLAEFAGYHAGSRGMECECFLEGGADVLPRPLAGRKRNWKRELLNCYASQARVLAQFPLLREPLRPALRYDFARPPHHGPLYYDHFDWGVRSTEWRELAVRAFRDLGVPCMC